MWWNHSVSRVGRINKTKQMFHIFLIDLKHRRESTEGVRSTDRRNDPSRICSSCSLYPLLPLPLLTPKRPAIAYDCGVWMLIFINHLITLIIVPWGWINSYYDNLISMVCEFLFSMLVFACSFCGLAEKWFFRAVVIRTTYILNLRWYI